MNIEIAFGQFTLEMVVGLFAWLIANWAYVDFRRNNERGFKRLVAFWMGWPMTLISSFVVREGRPRDLPADDTGLDELRTAIRRDRLLRERHGGSMSSDETTPA